MRAVHVREFGGPEVLVPVKVGDPEAGPGEVVVGLVAADVIFLDTLLRGGMGGDIFPKNPPYIPGGGGAGTVLSVGDGVDPGWVGRRVVAKAATGYAERIVASVDAVVEIPDGVDFPEAAAVLHDGVTAQGITRLAEIEKGEWVLVAGAAGGAGSLLVQLALDAGARVVAAARGERKLALARDLGAEATVDYSVEGWVDRVREVTGGRGADLVIDGAGAMLGQVAFTAAAQGGRFITYGAADGGVTEIDPSLAEERQVRVISALVGPPDPAVRRERLGRALAMIAEGRLRPAIGATFPLDRARDAHISLAARNTVGKSLLII
ncbi:zinc-binding dehydrogenase [Rhizohabitans arisaemae]|uniref:zinc-binding dehydrogenase n=1 Tax=Rhizohabitans arisaemae TaxID=2720610 RepID=UPI0024B04574|nr:zinc-binding dehydrogenase [Rhizohabitans arisaemae]